MAGFFAGIDFLLAGVNVALALYLDNGFSFVNWGAAVFCFGMGIACLLDK